MINVCLFKILILLKFTSSEITKSRYNDVKSDDTAVHHVCHQLSSEIAEPFLNHSAMKCPIVIKMDTAVAHHVCNVM